MKWRWITLATLLVLFVVPVSLSIVSRNSGVAGLENGRLKPCPASPNCVCSEDPRAGARIAPLELSGEPQAALESLVDFLRDEPRVELVAVEPAYVHAVFESLVFRFRDDVEFRLDAPAGVIQVRSASRVGYSDLGANRRRIESIRARWGARR